MKEAIIYLLVITTAEVVTIFVYPALGIVFCGMVFMILVMHSALASNHHYQNLIITGAGSFSEDNKPVTTFGQYLSNMILSHYLCLINGSSNNGKVFPGTSSKRERS